VSERKLSLFFQALN